MIRNIRLFSQQLVQSQFDDPAELVGWMGAVQAQESKMVKWAVGMRLRQGTLSGVKQAMDEGRILRTHVLRPTWHLVTAADIRWMLALSGRRILAANESFGRLSGVETEHYRKGRRLLEGILRDGRSLTRHEIAAEMNIEGVKGSDYLVRRILTHAEASALVCSGPDKGRENTYALLEERVAPAAELTREEALARLATKYFRSHSPASMTDFTWWSGLAIREAREAIELIRTDLESEKVGDTEFLIYRNCIRGKADPCLHLMPSYDEYLISYKDRSAALAPEHVSRAHSNNGLFYPVIVHKGRVVGNWKPGKGKKGPEMTFFDAVSVPAERQIIQATRRYEGFLQG